jgi:hypothetical protein
MQLGCCTKASFLIVVVISHLFFSSGLSCYEQCIGPTVTTKSEPP